MRRRAKRGKMQNGPPPGCQRRRGGGIDLFVGCHAWQEAGARYLFRMSRWALESGDLFERSHAAWLREHLRGYEDVWGRFIGNDGHNCALPLIGLDHETTEARKKFCQSHYSLALYARLIFDVTDEALDRIRANTSPESRKSCDEYLKNSRTITLFLALLGQICDMVEAIAASLKDNEIAEKISAFAKERNNAIHGARIPMSGDHVGLKIAVIARSEDAPGFSNDRLWESVSVHDFHYFEDWLEQTREKLFTILRTPIFPMIRKAATKRFGGREIAAPKLAEASVVAISSGSGDANYPVVCYSSTWSSRISGQNSS
jgi:hypothetical protein